MEEAATVRDGSMPDKGEAGILMAGKFNERIRYQVSDIRVPLVWFRAGFLTDTSPLLTPGACAATPPSRPVCAAAARTCLEKVPQSAEN
jgi:hypothetical protein